MDFYKLRVSELRAAAAKLVQDSSFSELDELQRRVDDWDTDQKEHKDSGKEMLAIWALCGMPTVRVGQRLAAALTATELPPPESYRMPWPAFLIDAPGVLEGFRWCLFGHCYCVMSPAQMTTSTGIDVERAADAIIGLARGTIIELNQKRFRTVGAGHSWPVDKRGQPRGLTFQLTRDVKIDCRQYVRDYVSGNRKSLAVQSMVRGHWKRQVCGEGKAKRKWIHVEPYWRGPEEAPIAVRSHVLKDKA